LKQYKTIVQDKASGRLALRVVSWWNLIRLKVAETAKNMSGGHVVVGSNPAIPTNFLLKPMAYKP